MGFQLSSTAQWVRNNASAGGPAAAQYDLPLLRLMSTATEALLDDHDNQGQEANDKPGMADVEKERGAQPAGQWVASNVTVAAPFSAICWYAGARMLAEAAPTTTVDAQQQNHQQQQQQQPEQQLAIGLIEAAVGGTPVQFWESLTAADGCPAAVANNETEGGGNLYSRYVKPLGALGLRGIFWDRA